MAIGPGKYDDVVTEVRARVGINDESGGGVVLIIFGGSKGDGFSAQADILTLSSLPELLEDVARQMRADRGAIISTRPKKGQ